MLFILSEAKVCTKCGVEYPATTEYFSTTKGNRGNDTKYLRGTCRKCTNADVHDHYHNVVKHEIAKKKELEGPKERSSTCKLLPYSKELNVYLKTCSDCERELPATREYFYRSKNGTSGVGGQCKECRGHKFTIIPKEGHIICYTCGQELLANNDNFLPSKNTKTGFNGVCRKCASSRDAKFRLDHLEEKRERDRQQDIKRKDFKKVWRFERYWADPEAAAIRNKENYNAHREQRTLYGRNRYKDNPKRYRVTERLWRISDAGKSSYRKMKQKRRAIRRNLPHDFTIKQWIACKEHFDNVCAYCGEDTTMNHDLDQEHFLASDNGGGYTVSNIVPSCRSCNSQKHTFYFNEWYPLQPSYTLEREVKILAYLNISKQSAIQQLSFAI